MPDRYASLSDDALLAALARGDEAAFAQLYHRHKDAVYRLACRFAAQPEDALDVLQETFAYLLRRAGHLKLTGKLTTLLYPVIKHIAAEQRRKLRRARPLETAPPAVTEAALPGDEGGAGELAALLRRLPEAQREVLLLRFVDDLSLEEIAAALAIPVGTVKSRLHNALAALRADPALRRQFDSG